MNMALYSHQHWLIAFVGFSLFILVLPVGIHADNTEHCETNERPECDPRPEGQTDSVYNEEVSEESCRATTVILDSKDMSKARAVAAVVGSLVADAAAMPLHWIYHPDKLEAKIKEEEHPEFYPKSSCPFYTQETGLLSCYGDHSFIVLESIAENKDLDIADYSERLYKYYGPGTDAEKGRLSEGYPVNGPWTNGAIKTFLKRYEDKNPITGEDTNNDMHTSIVVIPVIAKYAGQPEMLENVRKVIEVTSTNQEAITFGLASARLLEHYILNGKDPKAVETLKEKLPASTDYDKKVLEYLDKVFEMREKSHVESGRSYGIACGYPDVFQTTVDALLKYSDFVSGVRGDMSVGGDTCSRVQFIGACLAAQDGIDSIPEDWKKKTTCYPKLLELAENLVQ